VHEQAVEHNAYVVRLAENAFQLRAPAPGADNGEVARAGVAEAFAVEHERHTRDEVRLADDELAALLDLDDRAVGQMRLPAIRPTFWCTRTKRCKDAGGA
jgi:hypothetical protein